MRSTWRLLTLLVVMIELCLCQFAVGDQLVSEADGLLIFTLVEQVGATCVLLDSGFALRRRPGATLRMATKDELVRRGTRACVRGAPVWVPAANKGVLLPGIAEGLVTFESMTVCQVQVGPTKHSYFPESVQPRTITPAELNFDEPLLESKEVACIPGNEVEVLVGPHLWSDGLILGPTSLPHLFRVQVASKELKVLRSSIRAKVKKVRNGLD